MYKTPRSNETPQIIDFSLFKKSSTHPVCRVQDASLVLKRQANTLLVLTAAHYLVGAPKVGEQEFTDSNFEHCPKQFTNYQHEKTLSELLLALRNRAKTLEGICDLLNNYPVSSHVLECWARQKGRISLQKHPKSTLMGNEHQLILDLSTELRGMVLQVIVKALGMHLKVIYQSIPRHNDNQSNRQFFEEYGEECSKTHLEIEVRLDGTWSSKVLEKEENIQSSQLSSKNGYLRRSKAIDSNESKAGEYKSKKEKEVCEKCGSDRRCECLTLKRKGLTPKNTALSGFKSSYEGIHVGFVNVHSLTKIKTEEKFKTK